jgi:indolepyruvate ferredoxin oxidoreductase
LGCDIVVAATPDGLSRLREGKSRAIVNHHETVTAAFTRNPDLAFPRRKLSEQIAAAVGAANADFIDATRLATSLLGDSIASNLFLLGYAYQKGLIPVSAEAIERAIGLNAVAVPFNHRAFRWGRWAALDRAAVEKIATPEPIASEIPAETLDEIVSRRVAFLTRYQDRAYAARYERLVHRVARAEQERVHGGTSLTEAVARNLFKLMAYKDEYEVARLYTDGQFQKKLHQQFEGDFTLEFHLAPPLLAERDPATGHLKKRRYGAWMMRAFGILAKLKFLRGTPLDPFGYSEVRRTERSLIDEYRDQVEHLCAALSPANHAAAVRLAELPDEIRGYEQIKLAAVQRWRGASRALLREFDRPPAAPSRG